MNRRWFFKAVAAVAAAPLINKLPGAARIRKACGVRIEVNGFEGGVWSRDVKGALYWTAEKPNKPYTRTDTWSKPSQEYPMVRITCIGGGGGGGSDE